MGYGIKLEVWGNYALFTRPEMKAERVSYDVITPSAARGLIEAIYWKPAIKWVIDKIHVLNEIAFTNIRRNEVGSKISARNVEQVMKGHPNLLFIDIGSDRQQRAAMVLKNVRYIIEAHFEMTPMAGEEDTPEKHHNIAIRRMSKGQCYHMPCFGCREFPANFKLTEEEVPQSPLKGPRDFGWMLYDMDFSNPRDIRPQFFRAIMQDGIIDLTNIEKVG